MSGIVLEALLDPLISPEHAGWASEPAKTDDPVSHLRRLKEELSRGGSAAAKAKQETPAPSEGDGAPISERRKSPRLRCSGSAEVRVAGNEVRMWGTLTDISLHGCYVEMSNTFPIETRLDLVLKSCGIRIHLPGTVRVMYPALGMGIRFAEIEPLQHQHLKQLVSSLVAQGAASAARPRVAIPVKDPEVIDEVLRSADHEAFFAQITTYFQKNHLLSREEFYQIAKRARRR